MSRQPNGGFIGKENITDNTNASGVYTLSDVTQKVADNEFPTARYTPSRSLRFSAARSTYLSRTPASAGNRKTWTWSGWVKYSVNDNGAFNAVLFWVFDPATGISFSQSSNTPHRIYVYNAGVYIETTQFFRDASSWYHIVAVIDNTQATAADRTKLYINGVQVTAFAAAAYPALNADGGVNAAVEHNIGRQVGLSRYFDGYTAEVNFVDGQALTPTEFGEYEERTGEWKAKRYAGTYGTNGFYLSFANNSSTSALGLDDGTGLAGSGAGSNDWTTNNFSLAAGADYDSMVDVPGVGSAVINDTGGLVRGNYCTVNPLAGSVSGGSLPAPFDGNLNINYTAVGQWQRHVASMTVPNTGKWYWEITIPQVISGGGQTANYLFGIADSNNLFLYPTSDGGNSGYLSFWIDSDVARTAIGARQVVTAYGSVPTNNSLLMVAVDSDSNKIWWGLNGTWFNSADPAAETNAGLSLSSSINYIPVISAYGYSGQTPLHVRCNFGQQPFAYSPPAGFKTLCTTNLPEPDIKRPVDHFDVKLWTGNGTGQTIGNTARERDNYEISRSLRFNSADSAFLSRTPASAGNRKTWTWSGWVKKSFNNTSGPIFNAGTGNNQIFIFGFSGTDDKIYVHNGVQAVSTASWAVTTSVYKDLSSWNHFVLTMDTTQSTPSDRLKFYVNGVDQALNNFNAERFPTQNYDTAINNTVIQQLGFGFDNSTTAHFNGYLAEINFVDGQALDPESFGQFDVDGSWQAKRYTGTYGTNGFYLDFSDNSNTTATTLGKDRAGSNNWTPNNFSVAAGIDNDSMVDVPTDFGGDEVDSGGEVRGNYATMISSTATITNGGLRVVTASGESAAASTLSMATGKWYFEAACTGNVTTGSAVGILQSATFTSSHNMYEGTNRGYGYYGGGGQGIFTNVPGSGAQSYGATWSTGDLIGCAFDADVGTLQFFKNGVSQGVYSGVITNQEYRFSVGEGENNATASFNVNFGQRAFAYDPPAGFKSLNTKNMNEQSPFVTGPDFVWIKRRNNTSQHVLTDTVRGANRELFSSSTAAEQSNTGQFIQEFTSNGFKLGAGASGTGDVNIAGGTYVAWCWNAGSRTIGNQDGTITSTVRANPEAGFSIVTYTGTGVSGSTIGHGLNNAPKFIITKRVNSTSNWWVYSDAQDRLYPGQWQYLNLNFSTQNTANASDAPYFKTKPTSSVFSIAGDGINTNGGTYVSYLWSEVEGYSKFGTYTGNGSVDGPFIYTGFRPAFVIQKRVATTGDNWIMSDSKRGNSNFIDEFLNPNRDIVESNNNITGGIDYLSNGFKCRHTDGSINASGGTYIYMAFAEQPFKHAVAR